MSIKLRFNNREVNHPLAKLLAAAAGIFFLILVFGVIFFVFLPLLWFFLSLGLVLILVMIVTAFFFSSSITLFKVDRSIGSRNRKEKDPQSLDHRRQD